MKIISEKNVYLSFGKALYASKSNVQNDCEFVTTGSILPISGIGFTYLTPLFFQ
jgi:hypothetical protein